MKYKIYICTSCKKQLEAQMMGKQCPDCNAWLYSHECTTECFVKDKREEKLLKLLYSQFERMDNLRRMYKDVREIQDKYWHVLYLGDLIRMQQILEGKTK